jgi:hypothetical protein
MKIFIFALLVSSQSYAWTLNNNFAAAFKTNKVKVYVDRDTVCDNNNLTPDQLESLIAPAVEEFWNEVPTSALKLDAAGFSDPVDAINHGRLCSPTDDECIKEGKKDPNGLIPAVKDIVIACNDNALNFGGGNVLAVTIPNNFDGKKIEGALILINNGSDSFGKLSRRDQIGVIAHEIGHAIGLGHSKDTSALMYYRTVNLRKKLGQDDVDGVSFLYPINTDLYGLSDEGLLGGCGTISTDKKNPPGGFPPYLLMVFALGGLISIYEFVNWLKRAKARPSF